MLSKDFLEKLYNRYNKKSFVNSDPIQFLYRYDKAPDIEIAGLIASSLAYGRVAGILSSV
ncbi:MAG: TIGR02757 family protein, partial [Spirochaetes bacterium]